MAHVRTEKPVSGQITVTFTADQVTAIELAANNQNLTVSQWMRKMVLANLFTPSIAGMPPLQGFYQDSIRYTKRVDATG